MGKVWVFIIFPFTFPSLCHYIMTALYFDINVLVLIISEVLTERWMAEQCESKSFFFTMEAQKNKKPYMEINKAMLNTLRGM